MSDKRPKVSDGQISLDMLPYEVQQLVEVMSGLNPEWALEKWMSEQASNMLELIRGDLGREQMLIEQRLHRLHAIQGRLEKEKIGFDPQQRNIFDCFDLEVDSSLKGLGQRTANSQDSIQTPSIQEESLHYETLKHTGEFPIIGVNTFMSKQGSPTLVPNEVIRASKEEKLYQIEMLSELHKTQKDNSIKELSKVQEAAIMNKNIFNELMNASKTCSLGEITNSLFEVGGQYRRNM